MPLIGNVKNKGMETMASFPIEAVRGRFPALSLTDKGHRRIYLDNPAGTQVPQAVADAVSRCLLSTNANLGGFFETTVAAQQVAATAAGELLLRNGQWAWLEEAGYQRAGGPGGISILLSIVLLYACSGP